MQRPQIAPITASPIPEFYPVDSYSSLKGVSVYKDYTCMLNQTDIQKNANKFYTIQVLTDGNSYHVLTRYGRVGEKGRVSIKACPNLHAAETQFYKTYRDKTGYSWISAKQSPGPPLAKKYAHMEVEPPRVTEVKANPIVPSQLAPKVQTLISLISNRQLLERTLELFEIDIHRLPLGKISDHQIERGQTKLMEIQSAIPHNDKDTLIRLSSEFWTIIPFATKRSCRPPIIETSNQLQSTSQMLENMKQIGYAGRVIEQHTNLDDIYRSLQTDITPVESQSREWNQLANYIQNTHAPTHRYGLQLVNVYRIAKTFQDRKDPDNVFGKLGNHKLLIHGSRITNFVGILSQGLRIPTRDQVSNGTMFGRGIYYAESISKSFNYCYAKDSANKGLLLLCEVALGNSEVVHEAIDDDGPPPPYNSRHARGTMITNPAEAQKLITDPEVEIPCGHLIRGETTNLHYSEYIIYRPEQYRFRYIIELDCH